jgi:hypothetical protein
MPVDTDVITDGGEILHATADQGTNQVFRNSAQPEPADHYRRAILNVADGFGGVSNQLVHRLKL